MLKFTTHQLMSRNCMKILGTLSRRLDEHTVQALSAASYCTSIKCGKLARKIHPPNWPATELQQGILEGNAYRVGAVSKHPISIRYPLAFVWQREHDPSIFSFNLPVSYITEKGIDEMLIVASKMQNSHSCTASQSTIGRNRVLVA